MCGFLVTNRKIENLEYINHYIKYRGPDYTNHVIVNSISFVHNLLSMTGKFTIQPFNEDDIVCLYNGEIYNYRDFGDYPSDGHCLIPLYKEYGDSFVKKLDGEFCCCLFDFNKKRIIISTDVFRTKPLWIAVNGSEYGIASYKSALIRLGFNEAISFDANTTITYDLQFNVISQETLFEFDLEQKKNTYDDWNVSFSNAIKKRYTNSNEKVFIGLSSGYDSGAIACELNKQNADYYAYSIIGRENTRILKKRHKLIHQSCKGFIIDANQKNYDDAHKKIVECVEDFKYAIYSSSSDYNQYDLSVKDDKGVNA